MLTLYLACLVFGGVLLAISLFSGGDTDSDMDHSLDAHADLAGDPSMDMHGDIGVDHSLDMHADADIEASGDFMAEQALEVHIDTAGHLPADADIDTDHPAIVSMHGQPGGAPPTVHSAFEYFSFRNFIYTTTFFGMTGSALSWLAMPFGVTLGSSIGMGLFAGYVGHRFMRYLRTSESGHSLHVMSLLGYQATVAIPPTKKRKGKVRVATSGQIVEMLALVHDDSESEELRQGAQVFIVAIDKDVAYVDRGDFMTPSR
ncbi:MAG: hypothetical protein WBQ23_12945 [Bacteroidota bacterium]